MSRLLAKISTLLLATGVVYQAKAFSLLGPYAIEANGTVWQVERIGYNLPGDIGGPMNAAAGEEYRWNTPNLFYAYDAHFLNFFGTRGVEEIEKIIELLKDLPGASELNVDDYPMTAERVNFRAAALGIHDLKSWALSLTLEELGLASPNRWVYCLRNRNQPGPDRFPVFFSVIRRNFDPVTGAESPYINGRLWTYADVFDLDNPARSFTVNTTVDPLDFGRFDPAVAVVDVWAGYGPGSYFTGLTRDDVGAIKFIYQAGNWNFENAVTNATAPSGFVAIGGGVGGSPWDAPPGLTNIIGTNAVFTNLISTNLVFNPALRFGVDKLNFTRVEYDSILGLVLTPVTNVYTEFVVTNGVVFRQVVQRAITTPDILFSAADLSNGPDNAAGIPVATPVRTVTTGWQNNSGLGGGFQHAGPGVIEPPVTIAFNNVGFITIDFVTGFSGNAVLGPNVLPFFVLGAFDGTTNEPVIFSQGGNITLEQLEAIRLQR